MGGTIDLLICNLVSNTINIYLYFTDSYILHTHLGTRKSINKPEYMELLFSEQQFHICI